MEIGPAASKRVWMEATRNRVANRCLPLLMANQCGWTISNPVTFEAIWNGSDSPDGIAFRSDRELGHLHVNFGYGVLTFMIPYLFRTEPGYNLLVRGPANRPKDGIGALEGLVESDWITSTFTMNWKFTRPNKWVKFSEGEPVCMIVPMRRGELAEFAPAIEPMDEHPEIRDAYRRWQRSRIEFGESPEERERLGGWQKHYFRGATVEGERVEEHETKLSLAPFELGTSDPTTVL